MAISIDNSYMSLNGMYNKTSTVNADKLSQNIQSLKDNQDDEKLLDACKEFEQYFVEQVMKEFTKSIDEFQDNTYMQYFGDNLVSEYAKTVTDSGNLGLAQMLDHTPNGLSGLGVKPRGRLIKDQKPRTVQQCAGNVDFPPLSSRQLPQRTIQ